MIDEVKKIMELEERGYSRDMVEWMLLWAMMAYLAPEDDEEEEDDEN